MLKKYLYIFLFITLGIITSFLAHAILEISIIYLLTLNFTRYGLGLNWQTWFIIHRIGAIILLLAGVGFGFQQGAYWWKYVYADKKYSTRFRSAKNIAALFFIAAAALSFAFPATVFSQTKIELEAELKKIETQIAEYEKELATTKTEKQTLTNKINQLKKEQNKISLQIKSTNLQIKELSQQLSTTQNFIQKTSQKLNQLQEEMGQIIRVVQERTEKSPLEILGQTGAITAFFAEVEALEQLSGNLASLAGQTKDTKKELEGQYSDLETKQTEKKNLLSIQILQNQNLRNKTDEQNKILKETQGKEIKYQTMLVDSQKKVREIKNRIYELLGVSTQITFGQAVEIAQLVAKETDVRPAFLLAVLTQESNLGKNLGTCNRLGDPDAKSWRAVMKPDRDQVPFLAITKELNVDPDITPVSCPMRDANGNKIGWGGAMGPAQFIPSTWVLYKDRVAAFTGKEHANPWDIRDAFIAAALLLKDNGATSGRNDAEWRAAMLYFSGSINLKFRFYGDNVLALVKKYEEDIKALG